MNQISRQIPSNVSDRLGTWRSRSFYLTFVLLLLLSAIPAWSQDNATITGLVTDPSGAVVPNGSITLTNNATNQSRETVSNAPTR
jgi:hypothetical protein